MSAERKAPEVKRRGRQRSGFTMVEMLTVVAIMVIIASTALFTMWGTYEQAREARTRSIISRIGLILDRHWDTYRTRRVAPQAFAVANRGALAMVRLAALRETQRMEMPDRVTDVMFGPQVLVNEPALWRAYRRRAAKMLGDSDNDSIPDDWSRWTAQNQGSECLYLILSNLSDGDSTGLDVLQPSEIGDTDEDGMAEVLDGWRRPIQFLRWAPFFVESSPYFVSPATAGASAPYPVVTRQTVDTALAPDPLDPLQADPRWKDGDPLNDPYLLHPLVYSGGSDRSTGLDAIHGISATEDGVVRHLPSQSLLDANAAAGYPAAVLTNDPYQRRFPANYQSDPSNANLIELLIGRPVNADAADNINNHFVETR